MKNIFINLFIISFFLFANAQANETHYGEMKKPTIKEQKRIDMILDERLNLTQEQKDYIKENRSKHRKEFEDIIEKMQKLHDKIRDVYIVGIPKWQADLRTAHLKTELAILKQNLDKLKEENRKNFENILDENQKIEFEKIKKEFSQRKQAINH